MQMQYSVFFVSALFFAILTRSQTVQDSWITPAAPDFTSNLTVGELYSISWNSNLTDWFASYLSNATTGSVDLWITDYNLHVYAHLIASRQDLDFVSSLSWRVDVPADEVLATDEWVFRWLPEGVDYFSTSEQISSPGFFLAAAADTSSSTTSTTTTTSVSTSSSALSTSVTATSTSPATTVATGSLASGVSASNTASSLDSTPSSHGLSTGAKAGIAIAAIFGVAFSAGVGWFFARKIGNKFGPAQPTPGTPGGYSDAKPDIHQQQPFIPAQTSRTQLSELDSRASRPVPAQELPGH